MNTIRYMNKVYTVKDILKHESSGTIVITAVHHDDPIIDILQIRHHDFKKKNAISYENVAFPKHVLS